MAEQPGYETRDISIGFVVRSLVVVLLFVVLVLAGLWLTLRPDRDGHLSLLANAPFEHPLPAVNEPRLQEYPRGWRMAREEAWRHRLHSYGWVNQEQGVVHIPIARAMEVFLARQRQDAGQPHQHGPDRGKERAP